MAAMITAAHEFLVAWRVHLEQLSILLILIQEDTQSIRWSNRPAMLDIECVVLMFIAVLAVCD